MAMEIQYGQYRKCSGKQRFGSLHRRPACTLPISTIVRFYTVE